MDIIEKLKEKAREHNLHNLRIEIDSEWLNLKIENFLNRNPFLKITKKELKEKIIQDDIVASFFSKDPSKQNISEKYIAKVVSSINGISNFKNLPSSTNLYVYKGELVELKDRPIGVKTVDYIFEYKNETFVCCQKYTKEEGGHQDNQFNDVVAFLENSKELKNYKVICLLDGNYYNEERINKLKIINNNAIICSALELEDKINEKIK
jgi:hypothetical protein